MTSLTRVQEYSYALPALAMSMPALPVYVLLPTFYAENTALGLATIGFVLFAARLVDLLSDLAAGALCDRPPFPRWLRLGRRKGWIVVGGFLIAPSLVLLFRAPESASSVWLFAMASVLYVGWTFVQVPYLAWINDLSPHYAQRTEISGKREAFGIVGLVLSASWPSLAVAWGLAERDSFSLLAILTLILGIASFAWMFRQLPEPEVVTLIRSRWRDTAGSPLWRRLVLAWTLNGIANGIPAVLFPFFITEVLDLPESDRGVFLLVYFLSAVLALPVVFYIGRRIDKHRLWCSSMLIACLVFAVVPALGPGDAVWFAVVCVLTGMLLGTDLALPPAMLADAVDWDELRNRRLSSATFFAGGSLATKLALGIAVLTAPLLLTVFGWQDGIETQSAHTVMALAMIYAWIPCVLKAGTAAMMWNYPISGRAHRAIQRRLNGRRTPATGVY